MSTPFAANTDLETVVKTGAVPESRRSELGRSREQRVLVVARWPLGGIRTHLQYNFPTLAEAGYRFTFVVPDGSSLEVLRETLTALPDCELVGVPVKGPHCNMRPVVRSLLRSERFALMHSHGLTAGAHAALANLCLNVPHLVTVHDPLRRTQFPGLRGRLKRWALGLLMRQADALIAVSEDIRGNLLEYLPPLRRDRIKQISNGIDVSHFAQLASPETNDLRGQLGIEPGTALLGFLGRFMEQKGFLPLLDALEQMNAEGPARPYHLVAIGSGDYEREYRKAVSRRGLEPVVTMLGFKPDIQPFLRQLDLLVVPSLWEASSLLSMEAMCAGVPVLGTDCIGLREVLRNTPSRMVRAGDPAALCHGLQEALAELWTSEAHDFSAKACRRFDNVPSALRLLEQYDCMARAG